MGDFVKIAVKTALIAVICVAIYQLFVSITIPVSASNNLLIQVIGKGKAILFHYLPWVQSSWSFIMSLCSVALGIWGFYFAMLAARWVFKVNE